MSQESGLYERPTRTRRSYKRLLTPIALCLPVLVLLFFTVIWPVYKVVEISLSTSDVSFSPGSLERYQHILAEPYYQRVMISTITTSLMATTATLVVGYPLALYMAFSSDKAKRVVVFLLLTPLLISVIVRGYAVTLLIGPTTPINWLLPESMHIDLIFTRWAVLIGFVYTFLPYMVLSINASLTAVDMRTLAAARTLGASFWYVMRKLVLPLSLPGVAAGCVLVCVMAMSAVGLPLLLGGAGYKMWLLIVYEQVLGIFDWPTGFAMAIILFLMIGLMLLVGRLAFRVLNRTARV